MNFSSLVRFCRARRVAGGGDATYESGKSLTLFLWENERYEKDAAPRSLVLFRLKVPKTACNPLSQMENAGAGLNGADWTMPWEAQRSCWEDEECGFNPRGPGDSRKRVANSPPPPADLGLRANGLAFAVKGTGTSRVCGELPKSCQTAKMGRRLVETCLLAFLEKKLIPSTEWRKLEVTGMNRNFEEKRKRKRGSFLTIPDLSFSALPRRLFRARVQKTYTVHQNPKRLRTGQHLSARQACQASSSCQPPQYSTVHLRGWETEECLSVSGRFGDIQFSRSGLRLNQGPRHD